MGVSSVRIDGAGKRVTVFLGEGDRVGHVPAYEAIVRLLRERGCAGATVLRGVMGFGAGSRVHRASLLDVSQDLPVMVVWVDTPDRVDDLLPEVEELVGGGLVVIEDVTVSKYAPPERPTLG